jgi:dihydrofolate reductase
MRKVIVGAFVSLDGVMQAPGGPDEDPVGGFKHGGWVVPHFDEALGAGVDEMLAAPFDLLLGRKTYDIFTAHWPHVGLDDPIGALFNRITKYVATRNPDRKLGWRNSQGLGADAADAVRRLKGQDGPNLLTQGSTELLKTLFGSNLVDEIHLFVMPVVLGGGKKLFGDGAAPTALRLVSSRTSEAGVVISRYVRAGEVRTGSFALEQPTASELERRRNLT